MLFTIAGCFQLEVLFKMNGQLHLSLFISVSRSVHQQSATLVHLCANLVIVYFNVYVYVKISEWRSFVLSYVRNHCLVSCI